MHSEEKEPHSQTIRMKRRKEWTWTEASVWLRVLPYMIIVMIGESYYVVFSANVPIFWRFFDITVVFLFAFAIGATILDEMSKVADGKKHQESEPVQNRTSTEQSPKNSHW